MEGTLRKVDLKKIVKCAKHLIFVKFFHAIFSCFFEFSVHDANILQKKTIIGAIQINGLVRKLLKKNRVDGGYPAHT